MPWDAYSSTPFTIILTLCTLYMHLKHVLFLSVLSRTLLFGALAQVPSRRSDFTRRRWRWVFLYLSSVLTWNHDDNRLSDNCHFSAVSLIYLAGMQSPMPFSSFSDRMLIYEVHRFASGQSIRAVLLYLLRRVACPSSKGWTILLDKELSRYGGVQNKTETHEVWQKWETSFSNLNHQHCCQMDVICECGV